ncbi:ABC transporter ATP-binding protein [Defluviimonas salinarum]|uniref:ATP-binding cassette domain-containing protein n=1 Tax=Defluviimonas salinarum TaxID=2992147 RepID=A0ABT3J7G5_9RHOB|nr:oligopeptide/dipeptide ABC transporter ATP-binding protein [Defluviimonas salinarum]MCW3783636.1 ATP-binding cassette domain-containing protein [Defluviimonas salinarum]
MSELLSVRNLVKRYETPRGTVHAVDDVSFEIPVGHSVAVVGESGCGKSTLALSVLQLVAPTSGQVNFDGTDLIGASRSALTRLRREIGVVFQDPASSLNPRMRVGDIVGEPLRVHEKLRGRSLHDRVTKLFNDVGLTADAMDRYPHQFSGGQRQRISIARALALEPKLIVLDEPTSALDVSVQAQVLNLLQDLKARKNLSYLYISHSLATVEYLADILIVMYLGRVIEKGPADDIFRDPRHPYTRLLIDSAPSLDPLNRRLSRPPSGEIPSPSNRPAGCHFASRCSRATDLCRKDPQPDEIERASNHRVTCHHPIGT